MVTHHEWGESSHNKEEEPNEIIMVETPPNLDKTVKILRTELKIFKADNDQLMKEQEK